MSKVPQQHIYITPKTCLDCGCYELINSAHICISKVIGFTFSVSKLHLRKGRWALMCSPVASRVRSSRRRPLEGALRSCMPLGGALLWRGFCAEDRTCLKRQCHCDASGLHLCTLSLFFRRSDALCSAVGNWQPSCFAGYRRTGPPFFFFFARVPVGVAEVVPTDGLLVSVP